MKHHNIQTTQWPVIVRRFGDVIVRRKQTYNRYNDAGQATRYTRFESDDGHWMVYVLGQSTVQITTLGKGEIEPLQIVRNGHMLYIADNSWVYEDKG